MLGWIPRKRYRCQIHWLDIYPENHMVEGQRCLHKCLLTMPHAPPYGHALIG